MFFLFPSLLSKSPSLNWIKEFIQWYLEKWRDEALGFKISYRQPFESLSLLILLNFIRVSHNTFTIFCQFSTSFLYNWKYFWFFVKGPTVNEIFVVFWWWSHYGWKNYVFVGKGIMDEKNWISIWGPNGWKFYILVESHNWWKFWILDEGHSRWKELDLHWWNYNGWKKINFCHGQ